MWNDSFKSNRLISVRLLTVSGDTHRECCFSTMRWPCTDASSWELVLFYTLMLNGNCERKTEFRNSLKPGIVMCCSEPRQLPQHSAKGQCKSCSSHHFGKTEVSESQTMQSACTHWCALMNEYPQTQADLLRIDLCLCTQICTQFCIGCSKPSY